MTHQPWSQLVLIVYDIVSDRRRNKIHKLLCQYGVPVQDSAFEARLERAERRILLDSAARLIDPAEDSFNLYPIQKDAENGIVSLGKPRPPVELPDYFILD